jgi:hypothetical protein
MGPEVGTPAARRRKLFALADSIGLDREERIEISRAILWRDITSWSNLTPEQVDRMLDALEGYSKISWMLQDR